ncbi:hypothetical protein V6U89_12270 [Micromonospora sp. CPCC 206171]|uniref:hypothetical protein n=1 Tax=Micromonospora sp. CPCC 206171 TaxID=3122405 RepID=UPI002FF358B9
MDDAAGLGDRTEARVERDTGAGEKLTVGWPLAGSGTAAWSRPVAGVAAGGPFPGRGGAVQIGHDATASAPTTAQPSTSARPGPPARGDGS